MRRRIFAFLAILGVDTRWTRIGCAFLVLQGKLKLFQSIFDNFISHISLQNLQEKQFLESLNHQNSVLWVLSYYAEKRDAFFDMSAVKMEPLAKKLNLIIDFSHLLDTLGRKMANLTIGKFTMTEFPNNLDEELWLLLLLETKILVSLSTIFFCIFKNCTFDKFSYALFLLSKGEIFDYRQIEGKLGFCLNWCIIWVMIITHMINYQTHHTTLNSKLRSCV